MACFNLAAQAAQRHGGALAGTFDSNTDRRQLTRKICPAANASAPAPGPEALAFRKPERMLLENEPCVLALDSALPRQQCAANWMSCNRAPAGAMLLITT